MPPTYMNADSGRWSHLPSQISSKLRIVSSSDVNLPGLPVNDFGHEERLRQEPLDAAGAVHDLLVLFAQFVDAEDGDDVLQFAVPLQDLLHAAGDVVVLARRRSAGRGSRLTRPADRWPGRCPSRRSCVPGR